MSRVSAVLITSLILAIGVGAGVAQADVAPQVLSNSPTRGPITGGTSVTITGSGFVGATAVDFGGTPATSFTVSSDTSVVAVAPAHAVGVVALNVTGSGGSVGTRANAFTYFEMPVVTAVSPSTGAVAGGQVVTVTGTGFSGATAVRFGTTAATGLAVQGSTSLTATAPAGSGVVDVTVTTTSGGTSATGAADRFTYVSAPVITTMTPNAGPLAGGTAVTIKGGAFTGATSVSFGALAATSFTVVDDNTVTAVAPGGSAGTYTVAITTPYGTNRATPSSTYRIAAQPTVTNLLTKMGSTAGGNAVGIQGTGFTTATAVYFGSVQATSFNVASDVGISVVAPAGSGTVDVTVVTAGGTSPTSSLDSYRYVTAPAILGVSPSAGPTAGSTTVTITGTNLTGTTGVSFGAAPARSVTVVNDSTLRVVAPAHVVGSVDVTATTPYGTSATSAADVFTYIVKPVVTSSSPSTGPVTGGTSVTIIGTGFTGATAVEFGTTPTTDFVVNSDTSITVVSIAAVTGPGSLVNVTVDTPGGSATQVNTAVFRFAPIPVVTGVSPAEGNATGGNTVTITGTALIPVSAVHFGSVAATSFTQGSGTSITATVPPGVSGTVDVTVTTDGGTTATSAADHYRYVAAPVVTALSPASGPTASGTLVTISGADLAGVTAVSFGAVAAPSIITDSNTSLTVVAPAGSGVVDVVVTTAYGTSATSVGDEYAYLSAPTITAVNPASGRVSGGTSVTITGTGFVAATAVEFGATAATSVAFVSSTTLIAISPEGTPGSVDVTATTAGGTSATGVGDLFTYLPGPAVSGVSPSFGTVGGGTPVTITGTNFTGATSVSFGASAASDVTVVDDTTITAEAPTGAPGIVDVSVTTPNGTTAASSADRFTYVAVPTVVSLSPTTGPTTGGTIVTITGTGFSVGTSVAFGVAAATAVTVNSDTSLTVTSPPGAPGVTDVTVTTPGGTSATSSFDRFTFVPPPPAAPKITRVTPGTGSVTGGTVVTITGTGFTGATSVTFGGVDARGFTINGDTSITATAPAGSTGAADVVVTGADGSSPAATFTYEAAAATPTSSTLAFTGADVSAVAVPTGLAILALGILLVVFSRRRRNATGS